MWNWKKNLILCIKFSLSENSLHTILPALWDRNYNKNLSVYVARKIYLKIYWKWIAFCYIKLFYSLSKTDEPTHETGFSVWVGIFLLFRSLLLISFHFSTILDFGVQGPKLRDHETFWNIFTDLYFAWNLVSCEEPISDCFHRLRRSRGSNV